MKFIRRIVKDCNSIVFLDFEATDSSMEIISIGAIKAELDSKKQIKSYDKGFKCYVYTETKISPFIEEMTGITNELLDNEGISFEEAINRLSKYVGDPTFVHFFTYGNYDIRLLHIDAKNNELLQNNLVLQVFRKHSDFSKILNHFVRSETNQTLSLIKALKVFNVKPVEPIHDPLSDAKNLMFLYEAFLKSHNIIRVQYLKVIANNPNLEPPVKKLLNKLVKDKSVTVEDLNTYINEEIS